MELDVAAGRGRVEGVGAVGSSPSPLLDVTAAGLGADVRSCRPVPSPRYRCWCPSPVRRSPRRARASRSPEVVSTFTAPPLSPDASMSPEVASTSSFPVRSGRSTTSPEVRSTFTSPVTSRTRSSPDRDVGVDPADPGDREVAAAVLAGHLRPARDRDDEVGAALPAAVAVELQGLAVHRVGVALLHQPVRALLLDRGLVVVADLDGDVGVRRPAGRWRSCSLDLVLVGGVPVPEGPERQRRPGHQQQLPPPAWCQPSSAPSRPANLSLDSRPGAAAPDQAEPPEAPLNPTPGRPESGPVVAPGHGGGQVVGRGRRRRSGPRDRRRASRGRRRQAARPAPCRA